MLAEKRSDLSVIVIGGGLAGLAAATALAPRGFRVILLESRNRLGGRAGSFTDVASGQLVDTCQHVSMGCCTNLAHFFDVIGIGHLIEPQKCLHFMTPDGRLSRFQASSWPAPFHLTRSFIAGHYLTPLEKARIAYGLGCLLRAGTDDDPPFQNWLDRHWQTPRTTERFWGLVLVSALNEVPERIGLRYARKVFVDGFLRHRRGFEIGLPRVPLGRLYGEELQRWLSQHGVEVRMQAGVKAIHVVADRVDRLELRDGSTLTADRYVAAVPFDRLLDMLPVELADAHDCFGNLRQLETSPITSVHLWYDRSITRLPHVVLVGCAGQWLFNRGEVSAGEYYLQIVVSAARQFRGLGQDEVQRRIVAEIEQLFPESRKARLLRARVISEQAATFSAVPGVDRWRPGQATPLQNLFIAGDWTATGWPATMEGAVRSGYLAGQEVLKTYGIADALVRPDLGEAE